MPLISAGQERAGMLARMQRCLPDSRKRPRTVSGRRATRLRALLAAQIIELRTDAGISLRRLGDAAGVDAGYLQQVEAGLREPSISVLAAVAEALGADLSVRLYPNTGPRVRDHIQARIVEELLRIAHPRWRRMTEVPVYRPARGRIDACCMTVERSGRRDRGPLAGAASRAAARAGQRIKAESLPSADFWRSRRRARRSGNCSSFGRPERRASWQRRLRSRPASGVSRAG